MHTIRLRGPWEYRPANQDGPGDAYQRLKLPADWSSVLNDSDQPASFEFQRAFHCPTGITENDTVSIVIDQLPAATVTLNDQKLGITSETGSAEFPVTQQLITRNELRILIKLTPNFPCHGEVAIQIRDAE